MTSRSPPRRTIASSYSMEQSLSFLDTCSFDLIESKMETKDYLHLQYHLRGDRLQVFLLQGICFNALRND